MRAAVDDRTMAMMIAVCGLMGHECYPQDVEFQYQEAMEKIAAYREQQPLPRSAGPGGLGFGPDDQELISLNRHRP